MNNNCSTCGNNSIGCTTCKPKQTCSSCKPQKNPCESGYCGVAPKISCSSCVQPTYNCCNGKCKPCTLPEKCECKHEVKKSPCEDGVKISKLPRLDYPECGDWIPMTHDNTTMRLDWCTLMTRMHEYLIEKGCCGSDGGCCAKEETYYSAAMCKKFRRNNCNVGFMGDVVEVCTDQGDFISGVSQDDANQQALNWINANGQIIANETGNCIPAKFCPEGFDIGGQTAYQSTRIVLGDNAGTVRFLLGTYEQADAFDIYYGDVTPTSTPIWSSKSLPTANPTTGMVATANIRNNNYNNGLYSEYQLCPDEVIAGNNHASMYEIATTFQYNPNIEGINFVTLVTQAPEEGTRWSYKMGCPCSVGTLPSGSWNYCQDCSMGVTYYSAVKCANTQRDNCPSGYSGTTVNVCTTSGQFTSTISQSDADQKALNWLNANKQTVANNQGTCTQDTVTYWNTQQCRNIQRNNCPSGQTGSVVNVCVAANTYSSTVSQADANNKATAWLDTNGQTKANTDGTCVSATTYYNDEYCETFTRNNCPSGQTGSSVPFCAAANTHSSTISKADANSKAKTYVQTNGQTNANTNGTCTAGVTYYNIVKSQEFTRDNCPVNTTPGKYTYAVPANTYSSSVSQQDADQKALNDITANGQNAANTNGTCTPINTNPDWQSTGYHNCSTSDSANEGSDGNYYFYEVEDKNPNSSSYGTKEWRRNADSDGACDPTNTDPVWEQTAYDCSCSADSLIGIGDGPYGFSTETDVNPNSSTYNETRILRDSKMDQYCPIEEGEWTIVVSDGSMCDGYDLYKKETLFVCGVATDETRKGDLIEANSTTCGGHCDADWQDTENSSCEQVDNKNTGYRIQEQMDVALCSDTYGDTREVSVEDTVTCPIPVPTYCADSCQYTAKRTDCSEGYHADPSCEKTVKYFADDGTYCGYESKEEANTAALAAVKEAAESLADAECTCIADEPITYCNTNGGQYSDTKTRNDCENGYHVDGDTTTKVEIAANVCGYASVELANAAALAAANVKAQIDANTKGSCVPDVVTYCNHEFTYTDRNLKNDCPSGYHPDPDCKGYGHVNASERCDFTSQLLADAWAQGEADLRAQEDANSRCTCIQDSPTCIFELVDRTPENVTKDEQWANFKIKSLVNGILCTDLSVAMNGFISGSSFSIISSDDDLNYGEVFVRVHIPENTTTASRIGNVSISQGCGCITEPIVEQVIQEGSSTPTRQLTVSFENNDTTTSIAEVSIYVNGELIAENDRLEQGNSLTAYILEGSPIEVLSRRRFGDESQFQEWTWIPGFGIDNYVSVPVETMSVDSNYPMTVFGNIGNQDAFLQLRGKYKDI